MGVKGRRQNNANKKFQEPDLITGVEDILKIAEEKKMYSGNSLDIIDVLKTFKDVELNYESMEPNKSGSLKNENDKWILSVNKNHNVKRQKFTIAHELGHYFMHRGKSIEFEDTTFFRSDDMNSVEFMANEFAARLLMPESKVRRLIDEDNVKNIGRLAEEFGVSSAAMKYRVLALGYKMKDNG